MAIAFRSADSRSSNIGAEPAGTVEGDVVVACIMSIASAPTGPAGWTQVGTTHTFVWWASFWYIVRGASAPSYTWSTGNYVDTVTYSGCNPSSPINVSADGTDASAIAPSLTTTVVNTLMVCAYADTNVTSATTPSGMTKRSVVSQTYIAELALPSTGATGTKTWGSTSGPVGAWSVALKPLLNGVSGVSVSYGSFTRTSVNNTPWTANFTGGADVTQYEVRTAPSGGGTLVASGAAASGANAKTIAYNASGLVDGTQTLYVRCANATPVWGSDVSFTLLRDDTAPTASTTISTTPSPVV